MSENNFSNDYLNKRLTPDVPETTGTYMNTSETSSSVYNPIEQIQYAEEGEVVINKDDFTLSFEYGSVNQNDLPEAAADIFYTLPNNSGYRLLKNFQIRNNSGVKIQLSQVLPEGGMVIFNPFGQSGGDRLHDTPNIAFLKGDLPEPRQIFNLFHEIGHMNDPLQKQESSQFKSIVSAYANYHKGEDASVNESQAKLILQCERNAWA